MGMQIKGWDYCKKTAAPLLSDLNPTLYQRFLNYFATFLPTHLTDHLCGNTSCPVTCLFHFIYLNFEELKSVLFNHIKYETRDRCLTEHFSRFIPLNFKSVPKKDVVQVYLNQPDY